MLYGLSFGLKQLLVNIPIRYKTMSGAQLQSASPALTIQGSQKNVGSVAVATAAESKPKKKICCACPDTKRLRDECIVEHGESACTKWIEAHRLCLRAEGFNV
ncbi:Cytochrome c oxidase copper chaperone 1 [Glycine soja]